MEPTSQRNEVPLAITSSQKPFSEHKRVVKSRHSKVSTSRTKAAAQQQEQQKQSSNRYTGSVISSQAISKITKVKQSVKQSIGPSIGKVDQEVQQQEDFDEENRISHLANKQTLMAQNWERMTQILNSSNHNHTLSLTERLDEDKKLQQEIMKHDNPSAHVSGDNPLGEQLNYSEGQNLAKTQSQNSTYPAGCNTSGKHTDGIMPTFHLPVDNQIKIHQSQLAPKDKNDSQQNMAMISELKDIATAQPVRTSVPIHHKAFKGAFTSQKVVGGASQKSALRNIKTSQTHTVPANSSFQKQTTQQEPGSPSKYEQKNHSPEKESTVPKSREGSIAVKTSTRIAPKGGGGALKSSGIRMSATAGGQKKDIEYSDLVNRYQQQMRNFGPVDPATLRGLQVQTPLDKHTSQILDYLHTQRGSAHRGSGSKPKVNLNASYVRYSKASSGISEDILQEAKRQTSIRSHHGTIYDQPILMKSVDIRSSNRAPSKFGDAYLALQDGSQKDLEAALPPEMRISEQTWQDISSIKASPPPQVNLLQQEEEKLKLLIPHTKSHPGRRRLSEFHFEEPTYEHFINPKKSRAVPNHELISMEKLKVQDRLWNKQDSSTHGDESGNLVERESTFNLGRNSLMSRKAPFNKTSGTPFYQKFTAAATNAERSRQASVLSSSPQTRGRNALLPSRLGDVGRKTQTQMHFGSRAPSKQEEVVSYSDLPYMLNLSAIQSQTAPSLVEEFIRQTQKQQNQSATSLQRHRPSTKARIDWSVLKRRHNATAQNKAPGLLVSSSSSPMGIIKAEATVTSKKNSLAPNTEVPTPRLHPPRHQATSQLLPRHSPPAALGKPTTERGKLNQFRFTQEKLINLIALPNQQIQLFTRHPKVDSARKATSSGLDSLGSGHGASHDSADSHRPISFGGDANNRTVLSLMKKGFDDPMKGSKDYPPSVTPILSVEKAMAPRGLQKHCCRYRADRSNSKVQEPPRALLTKKKKQESADSQPPGASPSAAAKPLMLTTKPIGSTGSPSKMTSAVTSTTALMSEKEARQRRQIMRVKRKEGSSKEQQRQEELNRILESITKKQEARNAKKDFDEESMSESSFLSQKSKEQHALEEALSMMMGTVSPDLISPGLNSSNPTSSKYLKLKSKPMSEQSALSKARISEVHGTHSQVSGARSPEEERVIIDEKQKEIAKKMKENLRNMIKKTQRELRHLGKKNKKQLNYLVKTEKLDIDQVRNDSTREDEGSILKMSGIMKKPRYAFSQLDKNQMFEIIDKKMMNQNYNDRREIIYALQREPLLDIAKGFLNFGEGGRDGKMKRRRFTAFRSTQSRISIPPAARSPELRKGPRGLRASSNL